MHKICQALSAETEPDDLDVKEAAVYYAWLDAAETQATFPSIAKRKQSDGQAYTTLNNKGLVVRIHPDGCTEVL